MSLYPTSDDKQGVDERQEPSQRQKQDYSTERILVPETPPSRTSGSRSAVSDSACNSVSDSPLAAVGKSRPRNPLLSGVQARRSGVSGTAPPSSPLVALAKDPAAFARSFENDSSHTMTFADQDRGVWALSHSKDKSASKRSIDSIEPSVNVDRDHGLTSLIALFPSYPVDKLLEQLDSCGGNLEMATNVLLNEVEDRLDHELESSTLSESPPAAPPKKRRLVKKADATTKNSAPSLFIEPREADEISLVSLDSIPNASSILAKKPAPVSLISTQSASLKKKVKSASFSDEEDAGVYSDEEDSETGGFANEEEEAAAALLEVQMFEFFGRVEKKELIDTLICTDEQADTILGLRPFHSSADLHEKFEQYKKGKVKIFKLLEKYQALMAGYSQVDRLISLCEKNGGEIMGVMDGWIQMGASSPVKKRPSPSILNPADSIGTEVKTAPSSLDVIDIDSEEGGEDEDVLRITSVPRMENGEEDSASMIEPHQCLKRQPRILNSDMTLKSYQLVGVSWLNLLYSKRLGGILADEMGLGKTAQVIAFISHLKEQGSVGSPHLVIVPSSTLENWLREFANWSPSLNVLSYYGSQSEREVIRYNLAQEDLADYDAVVTTYNLAASSKEDRVFLKRLRPRSLILDEGHMVKNMESSRYKSLNSITAPFRLLLTGTPLQNNLMELLSLLTFIMPRIFAQDEDALRQIFTLKNSSDATVLNRQRIQRAKKMMAPFVLRRKKVDVLTELPSKARREVMCSMSPTQDELYQSIIADCKRSFFARAHAAEAAVAAKSVDDHSSAKKSKKGTSSKQEKGVASAPADSANAGDNVNVLMQLRKAANHPLLFRRLYTDAQLKTMAREIMREDQYMDANMQYIFEDMQVMSDFELHKLCVGFKSIRKHALTKDEWMDAGKVETLKRMLPEMIEKGDRILVFSQFVMMLNVLEEVLKTLGIKFIRLDGQTNVVERQSLIDQYNEDRTISVFLLSTKAGGLGLNLTSANVVIIYDMDFNPHNDAQAEDRAHRVGQTREVTVIRFIMAGTVEQHIHKLATTKLKLDKSLQQHGNIDEVAEGEEDENDALVDAKGPKKKGGKKGAAAEEGSGDTKVLDDSEPPASVKDDKKLMEMLRNEWRESGEAI
ncbi:hypothetical protein CcCBS67573_g03755 [Chytriomyces confervae]|uniref:DNA helicase n=1 Tax=Chytriomyces confervae TaxID=246404 RepID=A0A507FIT4_9FUNG|nr:hypothetical protein CcCBS67573_g03755 [Chytriomyces confervae]